MFCCLLFYWFIIILTILVCQLHSRLNPISCSNHGQQLITITISPWSLCTSTSALRCTPRDFIGTGECGGTDSACSVLGAAAQPLVVAPLVWATNHQPSAILVIIMKNKAYHWRKHWPELTMNHYYSINTIWHDQPHHLPALPSQYRVMFTHNGSDSACVSLAHETHHPLPIPWPAHVCIRPSICTWACKHANIMASEKISPLTILNHH